MKRILLSAIAAITLFVSCNKQQTNITPDETSKPKTAARTPTITYFLWDWDEPCAPQPGNCLPITIHAPRKHRYDELAGKILLGDNSGVKDLFAANREELSEVFVDLDIDGILSGDYHLEYHHSENLPGTYWFVVKSGTENVHVYPVDFAE